MQGGEGSPQIRELDRAEIEAILARNNVGRLAYARENWIDIQPVHYVYSDGWIYGRTSYGSKYEVVGETAYKWWPVAFEVDEIEDLFSWRSVVVHGGFFIMPAEGTDEMMAERKRAIELLRTLVPETFRENDPAPHRTVVFRIAVQEATGREASPPES